MNHSSKCLARKGWPKNEAPWASKNSPELVVKN